MTPWLPVLAWGIPAVAGLLGAAVMFGVIPLARAVVRPHPPRRAPFAATAESQAAGIAHLIAIAQEQAAADTEPIPALSEGIPLAC